MPHPILIFSQSEYLIQVDYSNSYSIWQTVQIQIRSEANCSRSNSGPDLMLFFRFWTLSSFIRESQLWWQSDLHIVHHVYRFQRGSGNRYHNGKLWPLWTISTLQNETHTYPNSVPSYIILINTACISIYCCCFFCCCCFFFLFFCVCVLTAVLKIFSIV